MTTIALLAAIAFTIWAALRIARKAGVYDDFLRADDPDLEGLS